MAENTSIFSGFSWLSKDTLDFNDHVEEETAVKNSTDSENVKENLETESKILSPKKSMEVASTNSISVPVQNVVKDIAKKIEENAISKSDSETSEEEDSVISDEENDPECSESEEENDNREKWRNKEGSEMYLLTIDGKPRFYEKTLEDTEKRIEDIVRFMEFKHPDWTFNVVRATENEYHLTRIYKWFLVQYEEVYRRIRFDKVYQIEFY